MPQECMELWARRFKIKEGLSGRLAGTLLPPGFLDDLATVACISQWKVFRVGRNWVQPRTGMAWQRVAGLFFFECSRRAKF